MAFTRRELIQLALVSSDNKAAHTLGHYDPQFVDKMNEKAKTLGMVNCTADFKAHPQVINGFSELMAEVFGEDAGVGARSAVGMGSLPSNIPVEIECIFEVT